jgi:hypothetical protein
MIVYVCGGEECKSAKKERKALLAVLEGKAVIEEVECRKLCEPPVCGVELEGKVEWFAEVSTPKALAGLAEMLEGKGLSKALLNRKRKDAKGIKKKPAVL